MKKKNDKTDERKEKEKSVIPTSFKQLPDGGIL